MESLLCYAFHIELGLEKHVQVRQQIMKLQIGTKMI